MMLSGTCFSVLLSLLLPLLTVSQGNLARSGDYSYEVSKCEPIKYPRNCPDLPYNTTVLPNTLGLQDQESIALALRDFSPLTVAKCSDTLENFLCMLYLPPCTVLDNAIPPCKSFCKMAVTQECVTLLEQFGYFDLPRILECSRYPVSGLCIGEDSTLSNETSAEEPGSWEEDLLITTRTFDMVRPTMPSPDRGATEVNLFFLITRGHRIQLLDITSVNEVDSITIFNGLEPRMKAVLDFYMEEKFIYWASKMDGKIFRGKLVQDELREVREIVDTVQANVEALAVDWVLGVLFWTELFPARLRTSSLSGRRVTNVVSDNMKYLVSLTLDPTEGKVFWIDRKGNLSHPSATIESYELVTNQRKVLFDINTDVISGSGRPKALAADIYEKRLYWADAKSDSLHSVQYDGSDHRVLLKGHRFLREPDSLSVHEDHVIWTDRESRSLVWANKRDGSDVLQLKTFSSHPPQNIRLFESTSQPKGKLNYNKTSLNEQWVELSSKENMELEDYDDYNEFEEDEFPRKKGGKDRKTDDKSRAAVFGPYVSLILLVLIL